MGGESFRDQPIGHCLWKRGTGDIKRRRRFSSPMFARKNRRLAEVDGHGSFDGWTRDDLKLFHPSKRTNKYVELASNFGFVIVLVSQKNVRTEIPSMPRIDHLLILST